MLQIDTLQKKFDGQIAIWLFAVCAMVFLMVVVGGITRLTESGLSMVTWKPISGILPPLSDMAWVKEFANYQNYPEYKLINEGMSLDEFKSIFYWEYGHRVLGRLIGVVFFIPFMVFLFQKKIKSGLTSKLWMMFILGGSQGLLGWWMVKSGLVNEPDVSHYRLTAHLGLAIIIYIYMFGTALELVWPAAPQKSTRPRGLTLIIVKLIFLQILLGGLVAGKNAGKIYIDWPLMDGQFIPEGLRGLSPWYMNFFENIMTIQFDHRMLAYIILGLSVILWFRLLKYKENNISLASNLFLFSIFFQAILGIVTLITAVMIHPAALHQAGAVFTLSAGLYLLNRVKS
jgi:cytochrome c oxidase assembly protein subunit 15